MREFYAILLLFLLWKTVYFRDFLSILFFFHHAVILQFYFQIVIMLLGLISVVNFNLISSFRLRFCTKYLIRWVSKCTKSETIYTNYKLKFTCFYLLLWCSTSSNFLYHSFIAFLFALSKQRQKKNKAFA